MDAESYFFPASRHLDPRDPDYFDPADEFDPTWKEIKKFLYPILVEEEVLGFLGTEHIDQIMKDESGYPIIKSMQETVWDCFDEHRKDLYEQYTKDHLAGE